MNPKQLLLEYAISPRKGLGQNFMHDPNSLEKIVATADLMPEDTVVEVGPGTGELTAHLVNACRHVLAIEVDERLRPLLEARFAATPNLILVFGDILQTDVAALVGPAPYHVVANVPYYITSAILRHFLESGHKPRRLVTTMQAEVAERLVAAPGNLSLLAVSVQFYGRPMIAGRLNPAVFWPRPEVQSAILRIDTYEQPPVDVPSEAAFFRVVRAGFSMKRKQLRNSLAGGLGRRPAEAAAMLEAAAIDPMRRAETLTLAEWARLAHVVVAAG
jgi:16S rRNA (adenine1518-N6/adenine1519-N6)-dimethyltransferase